MIAIPIILSLLAAGFLVIIVFIIARRIEDKRKETFEKRDN